jgi:hypothetical protein
MFFFAPLRVLWIEIFIFAFPTLHSFTLHSFT